MPKTRRNHFTSNGSSDSEQNFQEALRELIQDLTDLISMADGTAAEIAMAQTELADLQQRLDH